MAGRGVIRDVELLIVETGGYFGFKEMGIPSNEIKNLKKSLRLPTETPLRKKSLDQTLLLNAKICVCDDNYKAGQLKRWRKD